MKWYRLRTWILDLIIGPPCRRCGRRGCRTIHPPVAPPRPPFIPPAWGGRSPLSYTYREFVEMNADELRRIAEAEIARAFGMPTDQLTTSPRDPVEIPEALRPWVDVMKREGNRL